MNNLLNMDLREKPEGMSTNEWNVFMTGQCQVCGRTRHVCRGVGLH